MRFIKFLTLIMLTLSIAACEEGNDGKGTGTNNNQPGKLPNEDIDGTPDDDMDKPNEGNNGGKTDDSDDGNEGNDDVDVAAAEVSLKAIDIAENSISFELTSANAEEVRWLCSIQTTTSLKGEDVMLKGTVADANTTTTIEVTELIAGATYEIYGAAKNSKGDITLASTLVVKTPNGYVGDATYSFVDNITASVDIMETNGLRNDYVSFYDNVKGHTLFIDFYSPLEGEYLPSGTYPLGDGSSMTSDQQYTYILLAGHEDFIRITEGSATVAVVSTATGAITHSITANYTMTTGDTIALQFTGTIEPRK
ncbi:MAG: hypothetical protein IKJ38_04475 [Alistipes sp.]|nr:hypothetical protein [Alistipes sp.]